MPTTYLVTSYKQDYYQACREAGWDPFSVIHIGSVTNAVGRRPNADDLVITLEPYNPDALRALLQGSAVYAKGFKKVSMDILTEEIIRAVQGLDSEVST